MPRTPDRQAGDRSETATIYDVTGIATSQEGELRYSNGEFLLQDANGEFKPLGVERHKALRHLIHFIDSGPVGAGYFEATTQPFPTSYTWWTSSGKTQKIVELTVTRNADQRPTQEVWEMYDTDGSTVLATVTDTITYSGGFEATRTRVLS